MDTSTENSPESPAVPRHVAVIMDGNGRWAKERGEGRISGHRAGVRSVRSTVEECRRAGVRYLTLFSFSSENWKRPTDEVSSLMGLFKDQLESEIREPELFRNGVRLRAIGELDRLPFAVRKVLNAVIERTKDNSALDLVLAVSYGARQEIVNAARALAEEVARGSLKPSAIDEQLFAQRLWTADIPDPDLLIRTGNEMRISNFLLWQVAYTELVVVPEFWPDFDAPTFRRCLQEFAARERRFGLTSEQVGRENA